MAGPIGSGWRRTAMVALAVGGLTTAMACRGQRSSDGEAAAGWRPIEGEVRGVPVSELQAALTARLESGRRPRGVDDGTWRRVRELYGFYGHAPLFLGNEGVEDRARAVITAVSTAHEDALRPDDYPLEELRAALEPARGGRPSAAALAEADLLLTATYVAYAEDMLTGQISPRSVSQSWHIDPKSIDVDSAVARTLREARFDTALGALRPQDRSYALLRRELARYRDLAARGGWQPVPTGPALEPGEAAPAARLQALEARLSAEGLLGETAEPGQADVPPSSPGATDSAMDSVGARGEARPTRPLRAGQATYDARLAGAVAHFQARHGIVVDSILGAETVTSLNLPAEYRLAQIAANLERHRWLPHALGSRYILVNVPAFRLQAFDGGKEVLAMNVVVGSEFEDRSTPTFADSMTHVVFRPFWYVPDEIAEKEIFPKTAEDPSYFESRNYEYWDDNGKQRVRQKPGGENSLGLVKFMFPNDFAIYLHDTPEKALFQQDVRAASHGCIRLEHPAELARFVLGWDAARVQQAMETGPDDQRVDLPQAIPVFIAYFTAYERDGELYFGNDVYDRDRDIVQAVARNARPDTAATRMAVELRKLLD